MVGNRHRERVVVELARAERADHEVRPLERLVDRRWQVQAARARLEVVDVERVGVDVAVPARRRRTGGSRACSADGRRAHGGSPRARRRRDGSRARPADGSRGARTAPTRAAGRSGCGSGSGVSISPGVWRTSQVCGPSSSVEAVGRPAGDDDVVVLAEGKRAEHGLERSRALADEEDLVALAVSVEDFGLLGRPAERDLEVLVPHQAAAAVDRVAAALDRAALEVAVDVRIRDPLACARSA